MSIFSQLRHHNTQPKAFSFLSCLPIRLTCPFTQVGSALQEMNGCYTLANSCHCKSPDVHYRNPNDTWGILMKQWVFYGESSPQEIRCKLRLNPLMRISYSAIQSCFPFLYQIRLIRRISGIQLETSKHDWMSMNAFLCLPLTFCSLM